MYVSVRKWRDYEDGHLYNAGDPFPHDGRVISDSRVAELSGTQNKAGFALIRPCAVPNEEIPAETAEQPKKATRSRKKAT